MNKFPSVRIVATRRSRRIGGRTKLRPNCFDKYLLHLNAQGIRYAVILINVRQVRVSLALCSLRIQFKNQKPDPTPQPPQPAGPYRPKIQNQTNMTVLQSISEVFHNLANGIKPGALPAAIARTTFERSASV